MSRYLTPFKIGLLALTDLYCDAVIPTSATVPLLSFIVSQIIPRTASGVRLEFAWSEMGIRSSFCEALSGQASGIPGRTVWDLFLKKLWTIDSFDALDDFFKSLMRLFVKSKSDSPRTTEQDPGPNGDKVLLSRGSPLGVFVRRAYLEYTRLQFDDAVKLWKNFVKFREPTTAEWAQRNNGIGPMSYDHNLNAFVGLEHHALIQTLYGDLHDKHLELDYEEMISMEDMERLLEFQVHQMQLTGARMSPDMEKQLRSLLRESSVAPVLAHYVRFLNAWRAGNYSSSLENLHRYYDHSMQDKERPYYQYALLNMAMVHADFGCISEAVAALNEAIAAAREHKDINCLNFCFSWLYHLDKVNPHGLSGANVRGLLGSDKEALAFLKARAENSKTPSLFSSTLLSDARLALSTGESIYHALELVYKSSHTNLSGKCNSVIGTQLLIHSAIFGRLGLPKLSEAYCDILIRVYGSDVPQEDVLRALCRKADIVSPYVSFLAVCVLKVQMSQRGDHKQAVRYLREENSHYCRTLRHQQYLSAYIQYLEIRGHIHRYELNAAERGLSLLDNFPIADPSLSFEVHMLHIRYLMLRRSYAKAFTLVEEFLAQQKENGADIYQAIRLLSTKAILFAEVGRPERGFSSAVRALSLGIKAKLQPAIWEAVCALGTVLNTIEEFQATNELVDAVIPQAIEGENVELTALLYSVHADAMMGLAGKELPKSEVRNTKLHEVLRDLRHASSYINKLEDPKVEREMLDKQNLVLRALGEDPAADAGRMKSG